MSIILKDNTFIVDFSKYIDFWDRYDQ